jgi:hypothetical protein
LGARAATRAHGVSVNLGTLNTINCGRAAMLIAAALISSGCQSSSTNVLGPSGTKCAITVPTTLPAIGADGGAGSLTITVAAECVWSASSGAAWIAITSNASGQGSGTVSFVASVNPTATVRQGALIVGERRVEIQQTGATCQFNLVPPAATVASDGGEGEVTIAALEGCQWSASSQAPWLAIDGAATGTGTATLRFRAEPNDGAIRAGTLTIANRTFVVNQGGLGSACSLSLGRTEQAVPASGGTDTISIAGPGNCPWTAVSHAPWITVVSGANGNGTGTVSLTVAANTGPSRVGVVSIAGHNYVVTQATAGGGACAYAIGAPAQSIGAPGGAATIPVAASNGCGWSAMSHAPWIAIASGFGGNGNGLVVVNIATNSGAQRVGLITIAGFSHVITQQSGESTSCSYALGATQGASPAGGGPGSVTVTAAGGCAWTAASQAGWITVMGGSSGNGKGTVSFSVAANNGAARNGGITIAGQTYTVAQAAASQSCSYSLSAGAQSVAATAGQAAVSVTAGSGCAWTASSQAGWIAVTSGASGSGNGSVVLSVGANTGAERSGSVTIAGHTHTITQAAAPAPCSYALDSNDASIGAAGATTQVGVSADAGCAWTAQSQASWISISSGASGSGDGTVRLTVSSNASTQRVGTVVIAGQAFTVTQAPAAAACTYSLSPTTQAVALLGGEFSVLITTQAGCTWNATAENGWIQLTSDATGTGTGILSYRVSLALLSRNGGIAISGERLTVNQTALLVTDGR